MTWGKIVVITGREINSIPLISSDTRLDFCHGKKIGNCSSLKERKAAREQNRRSLRRNYLLWQKLHGGEIILTKCDCE